MKKIISVFALFIFAVNVIPQQTFTSFQNANLVIGQPNFQTQYTSTSDTITYKPTYSAISSKGMLAVAEQTGGSVKIWYKIPVSNGQPADVEVGNPDFFYTNNGPNASYSEFFDGVAWSPDGNKLIATCGNQNRVLIWNSVPATNGQPADVVLGQPDFYSITPGASNTTLRYPCGVMVSPGGKLLVAEFYNHRVLVWNSIPETNGAPADVVIGQPNFTSNTPGNQANQLNSPWGVNYSPDGKLLIANAYNHNIYVYDSIPASNGESATLVIGHNQFGLSASGTSDSTMYSPAAATVTVDGKVAVAEFGNNRVLIFNSLPVASGAHADVVLGQPNFSSGTIFAPSGTADTNNMSRIYNVSTDLNGRLFVTGRDMHRVLVFGELPGDSADLSVSISGSSNALCDSSDVFYSMKIHNPGPDTAKNIVSTTAFPEGYTVDSINAPDGTYNKSSGYWNIPYIAPLDSAMLIINGFVDAGMGGQAITTYANIIYSSAIDTNLNNNGTSNMVTILAITRPDNPVAGDTQTCYGSPAMLSASGEGKIYWYAGYDDVVPLDTGDTYASGPLTAAATFYAEANNGCPSSNRTPVHVDVNPVYYAEETLVICSGESYTFPDGSIQENITAPVTDTSYLSTVSGCDSIIVTTVNVNPVYSLSETVTICSGESYTFPDGSTQENITVPVTDTSYLSTVSGCDSVIVTTVNINPVYNLHETVTICSGESYTFPDGSMQENITAPVTDTCCLVTAEGCDSIIITELNITSINVSVTADGITLTAATEGAGYQWVDCNDGFNPLAGETSRSFIATVSGSYAVIINESGCSDTSGCYSIYIQGLNEKYGENMLVVYPNPVKDIVNIEFSNPYNNIIAEVINLQGSTVLKQFFGNEHKQVELDLTGLETDVYIIRLISENNVLLIRVVKQ
jgi:hypothetical protein